MEIRKPEIDCTTNSTARSFGKILVACTAKTPMSIADRVFSCARPALPGTTPSTERLRVSQAPPHAAHTSPTENEDADYPIPHFGWSFQPPYGNMGGQTPRFHKKIDRRISHPHDLGEKFVPGALPATPGRQKECRIIRFLRILTGRYTGRFFLKEKAYFVKIPDFKRILLGCWHRFHCRISGPFPARDLSVGERIPGERRSW